MFNVMTELKNCKRNDVFIACYDCLTGFPQAIETVYLRTEVQLCIVHMVRNCLTYVSFKDRKHAAKDLRAIYQAITAEQAEAALDRFANRWDERYARSAGCGAGTGTT